jgi:galactokinase
MVYEDDRIAIGEIKKCAQQAGIDLTGAKVRRSSSRFCLGVEHGDYNGTELFGVGTDRFIWMAYKKNDTGRFRLFSANFPDDGVVEFESGKTPGAKDASVADSWARFAFGVDFILRREGFAINCGFDAVIYGNIPGGGMSRSASLALNLILSVLDVNDISVDDDMRIVDLAQAVENDYIGSPCGNLDQIMILFAKEGMGTHYDPGSRSVSYVQLGEGASDFRIVVMDTGTVRPGLEKSTYKVRRSECEELTELIKEAGFEIDALGDIKTQDVYEQVLEKFGGERGDLCDRLSYIFYAQQRFYEMMAAWKNGDIETVGRIFREDGIGLRDLYKISGPELETMCDIARTVPGVLGERMLGGGDKGAAGAIVLADAVDDLKGAVDAGYGRSRPGYADKYAVHVCRVVDGIKVLEEVL